MLLSELKREDVHGQKIIERLGLAWVKLNKYQWDEILGDKPDGFDEMTTPERYDCGIISKQMRRIEDLLGEHHKAITSMCWWKFELKEDINSWIDWYLYNSEISLKDLV